MCADGRTFARMGSLPRTGAGGGARGDDDAVDDGDDADDDDADADDFTDDHRQ